MCVHVHARARVHVLVCVRGEGTYCTGLLMRVRVRESVRVRTCSGPEELCAMLCKSLCQCVCKYVRVRESVRARACRATTGPDSPWVRERSCGAWLCGQAKKGGLRMGWLFAKMAVTRAL